MNRASSSGGVPAPRTDPTSESIRVEQATGWSYWWAASETELQAKAVEAELCRLWIEQYRRPGDILCELIARCVLRTTFARRQAIAGPTPDSYAIAVRQVQAHRVDTWVYNVELDWEPAFHLLPRAKP